MSMQHAPSQGPAPTGRALLGLGLLIFSGDLLDKTAVQSSHLLCTLAGDLVNRLPATVLATCQALETFSVGHEGLLVCLRTLASVLPLLHSLLGMV
jgi:hypothetical protein